MKKLTATIKYSQHPPQFIYENTDFEGYKHMNDIRTRIIIMIKDKAVKLIW